MKVSTEVHEEARKLRSQGESINEISKILGRPKSSVSKWVRSVELTKEQKKYLDSLNPAINNSQARKLARDKTCITWMERRKNYQDEGKKLVTVKPDHKFFSGLMLYWAEGAKCRTTVSFSNTDVHMLKFFLDFLKKYFNINNSDIALSINCHLNNGFSLSEIEDYWVNKLDLDKNNLKKSHVEHKRIISGKRKNIHLYGVCTLRVHSVEITQKIYGAIQEYIGFNNPEWLK